MSSCKIPDVPYVFQGVGAPRCHVACLSMILEFYDIRYAPSYLMNLSGYNYGFRYFKEAHVAFAALATPLGPWQILSYAVEKIGCKANFIKDKPWDETWELLKDYLGQGIPVYVARLDMQYLWKTTRPTPHVVVLCGYDEKRGVVMIHDPALGDVGEGIQYLPPNGLPDGMSGRYAEFSIAEFMEACALKEMQWTFSGKNGFCVIDPPTAKLKISLAEVIERNAKLSLGKVSEVIGANLGNDKAWGPDGILGLADDLERGFGLLQEPEAVISILGGLRGLTLRSGSAYKLDASAFVSGLSVATGSRDLERASYYYRLTALCYEQGLADVEHIMQQQSSPQKVFEEKLARISELLR